MSTDLTIAIIEHIEQGRCDDSLGLVAHAVTQRQKATGQIPQGFSQALAQALPVLSGQIDPDAEIQRGDTIKVTGRLSPNYLMGHTFVVKRIAFKRGGNRVVVVDVPNEPQFRRFAGVSNTKIPLNAVAKVVA